MEITILEISLFDQRISNLLIQKLQNFSLIFHICQRVAAQPLVLMAVLIYLNVYVNMTGVLYPHFLIYLKWNKFTNTHLNPDYEHRKGIEWTWWRKKKILRYLNWIKQNWLGQIKTELLVKLVYSGKKESVN